MTPNDEDYVYFQECLIRLNRAWEIICKLQSTEPRDIIWGAAYQMAIIEYAKPYKESRGTKKWRYILPLQNLTETDRLLHDRLLSLRDTFLAHSDITIKDAKVFVGSISENPLPLIISNTEPEMPQPHDVRALIELTLKHLYDELPNREALLFQANVPE
ncbi:hypothetical protein [Ectopseudomonas mendocina]|jgi:hypothetical protein|uniref:hypothetical protein n=1 Tax=Ectopseudomonas mendocina TaxID=300 RepID=UPI00131A4EFE|nr:hypothetical protein [Pseudomonas mendocina]